MAAANYNRPKPIDPLTRRWHCTFRIFCQPCGRLMVTTIGEFAQAYHIPGHVRIYEVVDRLRCSVCGGKPEAEVVADRR